MEFISWVIYIENLFRVNSKYQAAYTLLGCSNFACFSLGVLRLPPYVPKLVYSLVC